MADAIDVHKGIVAWFDVRRGFGFITPEAGGENLFFHQSSVKAVGHRSLAVGEAVEFVVSMGNDGRRRAVRVTAPRGSFVHGRPYFAGACYHCGEVGHMMIDCKSDVGRKRVGPCYKCGLMGSLATECPNIGKISPLCGLSSPLDYKEETRTQVNWLSENIYSEEEEEEEEEEEISNDEFPRGVEQKNWAVLPRDVLSMIFKKITSVDIIRSAQFVCRSWRQLSYEPELWRSIVVKMTDDRVDMSTNDRLNMMSALESLAMLAVDRSQGCVEDFYLENFTSQYHELLNHMADRSLLML